MNLYEKKIKVISNSEILGLVIVFIGVLYLLYPKSMLEKQVLAESSNYDLTATYVENMLRIDPSNRVLMYTLAKMAMNQGKIDLALSLSNVLLKNASKEEKDRIYQLEYKTYKQEYLYAKKERKAEIIPILKKLTRKIHTLSLSSQKEREFWFKEMLWLKDYKRAMKIVNEVLSSDPKNLYWLNQKYELAVRLHDQKEVKDTLNILLSIDTAHHKYWLRQAYHIAEEKHDKQRMAEYKALLAGTTLEKSLKKSIADALDKGLYLKAADLYMQLYEGAKSKEKRKEWLQSALDVLVRGGIPEERVKIIRRVESDFLHDPKMIEYFLKIYLESDKLDYAVALSKKLLDTHTREEKK